MAISVRNRVPLGPGAYLLLASYTHTAGAAEESLVVSGGAIYLALVNGQVAANTAHQTDAPGYTTSTSGALTTVTFKGLNAVSAGTLALLVGTSA